MISIIVYGRNDERGYGMHKRVAISLNSMAHVLSAPTSEILFVDYNTPDHLPSLLELIRDDLTDAARIRTRVLRVRPAIHARYADLTPLPVLEPIARNVALRRSRAQNPWILSTNTDSIMVPEGAASLCEIVAGLEGRHYGAPRFELPERVWETFDRRDPARILPAADGWSARARLREAVRGEGAVQFDSPGDFQLVRRADLFSIDGFNEEALLGWHIDYNLAHRLALLNGPEGNLEPRVRLYHCGHARRATQTHNADRVENSLDALVHNVRDPGIPAQRDSWGCPDDDIEEIDLCAAPGAGLLAALDAVVAPLPPSSLLARYDKASFESLAYDAGHVAAHLTDLLSTWPRTSRIAYAGCRTDMLDATIRGLSAMGFTHRLAIPDTLCDRLGAHTRAAVETVPLAAIIDHADLFLFEFGLIRDEAGIERAAGEPLVWTADEEAALDEVVRIYRACIDAERQLAAASVDARLIVTIGVAHSRFEPLIDATLSATPSPFTTRLRYGVVKPDADARRDSPAPAAPRRGAWSADIAAARSILSKLVRGDAPEESRLDIAIASDLVRSMVVSDAFSAPDGVSREDVLIRLDETCRPPEDLVHLVDSLSADAPPPQAGSSLARLSDWDDADWLECARRIGHGGQRGAVPRNGWVWQRAQLMYGLSQLVGAENGRALIVSEHPDSFVSAVGRLFAQVDLADIRDMFPGEGLPLVHVADFSGGALLPDRMYRVSSLRDLHNERYDAIILPHSSAFRASLVGLGQAVAELRPLLAKGGVMAIAGEIALLGPARNWRPDIDAASEGLAHAMSRYAGLGMIGGTGRVIGARDAALTGLESDLDRGRPVLGVRRDGDVLWPAVWFFEAAEAWTQPAGLSQGLARLALGEQAPSLSLTGRAHREDGAIVGRSGEGDGHIFFGPFLRLPSGAYRAEIDLVVEGGGRLVAEVSSGDSILSQTDVAIPSWTPSTAVVPFRIDAAAALSDPCEIRLWSSGQARVRISSVRLHTD